MTLLRQSFVYKTVHEELKRGLIYEERINLWAYQSQSNGVMRFKEVMIFAPVVICSVHPGLRGRQPLYVFSLREHFGSLELPFLQVGMKNSCQKYTLKLTSSDKLDNYLTNQRQVNLP